MQPADEPVCQFLDKKRSEGKSYKVYIIAGANKFFRNLRKGQRMP